MLVIFTLSMVPEPKPMYPPIFAQLVLKLMSSTSISFIVFLSSATPIQPPIKGSLPLESDLLPKTFASNPFTFALLIFTVSIL